MATNSRLGKKSPANALAIEDLMGIVKANIPIRELSYLDIGTHDLQPLITLLGGWSKSQESNRRAIQAKRAFCVPCKFH